MNIFTQIWFWMLIVGVIALFVGFYFYVISRPSATGIPWWVYLLIILGAALLVLSLIIAANVYFEPRFRPDLQTTEIKTPYQQTVFLNRQGEIQRVVPSILPVNLPENVAVSATQIGITQL